ncbi:MAG: MFS transporter [Acetobacteraceae bacterium]
MRQDRGASSRPRSTFAGSSVEGRSAWVAAAATLAILSLSYGAPLIVVVDLTRIQSSLGTDRSVVALASAFVWLGTGVGGILMGRIAERVGIRVVAAFGAVMMAGGLAVSSAGTVPLLLLGHGVMMGVLGNGALYPPLVVYVSRWFDRHRGTAIALISSGQYVAGVFWPAPFERVTIAIGWQATMLAYAALILATVLPLALLLLRPFPAPSAPGPAPGETKETAPAPTPHGLPGLTASRVQAMLCVASFLCCVPMAIPAAHLVAFAGSVGITAAMGAAMLSVMLGSAFVGRQLWGLLAEHIGGLPTLVVCEACQTLAIALFAVIRNESALFVLAAAYGFGFAGIIPSYVLVIRELFVSADAATRIPLILFTSTLGMAFGTWFAGALFDHFGTYAPAFVNGALFNLANLAILGFLLARWWGSGFGAGRLWRQSTV